MKMHLKSVQNLPKLLLVKTAKHLGDVFWKYSVASQFLLKSFEPMSGNDANEESICIGKINLIFGDERQLIIHKTQNFKLQFSKVKQNFLKQDLTSFQDISLGHF